MSEIRKNLDINQVQFDKDNPRIKGALDKYGSNITAERIHFALKSSGGDTDTRGGFHQLKNSIKANNGIAEPIKVVAKNGQYVCIDGNTRLAIYREFFKKQEMPGDWSHIPAFVVSDASQLEIEKIRVIAHLVGARPWPAYEKAKYLHHLYYSKLMDVNQMIELCGGNKASIEREIEAFTDMNEYYRDKVEDDAFKIDRFSGFVELQKQGVKDAIFEAGFELSDFGEWIATGKIYNLADVRSLPKILRDEDAKTQFIEGGVGSIKEATRIVDEKNRPSNLNEKLVEDADIEELAYTLYTKISKLPFDEVCQLKSSDTMTRLQEILDRLASTLKNV